MTFEQFMEEYHEAQEEIKKSRRQSCACSSCKCDSEQKETTSDGAQPISD